MKVGRVTAQDTKQEDGAKGTAQASGQKLRQGARTLTLLAPLGVANLGNLGMNRLRPGGVVGTMQISHRTKR